MNSREIFSKVWKKIDFLLRLREEGRFWGTVDLESTRRVSWDSLRCLSLMAVTEMTGGHTDQLMDLIIESLVDRHPDQRHGLTLGCGDMLSERGFFLHPALPFAQVDAYDLSVEALKRAKQATMALGLQVEYHVADVNRIALPSETYDLVVITHAMHHFKAIEHVARQIYQALKPGGLFVLWDYVGPRYQQFSRRQCAQANAVLQALPPRYRRDLNGRLRTRVHRPSRLWISPNEAIRSDQILPAVNGVFKIVYQYNWAGLLFPLLRGIAVNFDEQKPEDRRLLTLLFEWDRLLCRSGQVEPNFTITVATKNHE